MSFFDVILIVIFLMVFGSSYNHSYKTFICIIIFDSCHKPVMQIVYVAIDKKMRERESESNASLGSEEL